VNGHLAVTAKFTLKNCVVPNVKGKTLSAARQALKTHSCSPGKIKRAFSNAVQAGRVISESPQAGTHLRHNGKVTLTVSEGTKP
jgi:serine/threonine-protein kinase